MLLMRLSDALDQLAGLDGQQTHRSWWVAKPAVTGVKRAYGRAALTLANGAEAPVSRRFSRQLRTRGWY
jgi:DNA-binding LytR/AlgR family response regulator